MARHMYSQIVATLAVALHAHHANVVSIQEPSSSLMKSMAGP